jgi:hypothetical protein
VAALCRAVHKAGVRMRRPGAGGECGDAGRDLLGLPGGVTWPGGVLTCYFVACRLGKIELAVTPAQ